MPANDTESLLIDKIRAGSSTAWNDLISRYEGRLLAFVDSRLRDRQASEDVVQETFLGFLTSLPHYDRGRSLESWLFSIAAHKLTDHLRRVGRRPALPLGGESSSAGGPEPVSPQRAASSLLQSGERRQLEGTALAAALRPMVQRWCERDDWDRVQCLELLFVRAWPNKQAAEHLGLSEQAVANYKHDFLARLRDAIRSQGLSADVFPELQSSA